jgi:predicted amidohydrolase YtcJ
MMPNLILYNAKLIPMDPACQGATAAAIRDSRFLAVGSDDEILDLAGTTTRKIDLEGRTLLPGLSDSHIHFYDHALGPKRLQLADSTSVDDLRRRLRTFAEQIPQGEWISGRGWNETRWSEQTIPSRTDLDQAAPDHPVILWRSDMHLAIVNSLALEKAGITKQTPDPPQGRIDRDSSGEPSGGLRERAINIVRDLIPLPSEQMLLSAMQESFASMHRVGITAIHDCRDLGGREGKLVLSVFTQLAQAGQLQLRTWMHLPGERLQEAISLGLRTGYGDSFLRIGHLKFFSDGSQGAHTAWMLEPYEDSGDCGMPLTPMEQIEDSFRRAHEAGLAVAVHAIGDRATRELVNVLGRVSQSQKTHNGESLAAPHRIEHVQNIRPEDLARMSELNVVASVQPIHLADDITLIDQTVGARGRFAYPLRDILDAGVVMAFGSDAPVADHNPFLGIHAAITRQRANGTPEGGWYPEQRISLDDALWCYCKAPHIASGRQAELGSITPGSLADAVVIDGDLQKTDPEAIPHTKVFMTIFDGKVVYEA